MNFLQLSQTRYSARKYRPDPVDREKILRCLEAARLAPSACNSQPWSFIVVDEQELKAKVAAETYTPVMPLNRFVHQAPVLLVLILEKSRAIAQIGGLLRKREYRLIDIGIAAEHICLQAAEEGLGTCMLGWFNEKGIQRLLGIPAHKRIGLLITLGYSEGTTPTVKSRKSMDQLLHFNFW